MNIVSIKYINLLIKKSKEELNKDYNFNDFNFTDFELINSFLIDTTLNEKKFSLLINYPNKETKKDYYVPIILSVAINLFYQNYVYVDDNTIYQVGDIVQKDGRRYKIIEKEDGEYTIESFIRGNPTKIKTNGEGIKKYIITTADLSNKKVKIKFKSYKRLFDKIFKVGSYLPSKFIYKSVIIAEKKEFLKAVKESDICELDFHKSFPFQYITKTGRVENNLPLEPMIYIVPDYETFREFVSKDEKDEKIECVIFIGENKYKSDELRKVKRDLRSDVIKQAIFIGKDDIEDFEDLKKWNWTLPEPNYFNKSTNSGFEKIKVEAPQLLNSINEFEAFIKSLEKEYIIELDSIFKLRKDLFSLILPDSGSRLENQIDYVRYLFRKEIDSLFKEKFFNININPEEKITNAFELIDKILSNIPSAKFELLHQQEKVDILLVPKCFQEIWQEKILKYNHLKNLRKTKVLNLKEFFGKENDYTFPLCRCRS